MMKPKRSEKSSVEAAVGDPDAAPDLGPHLPDDSAARKEIPLGTGLVDYFPDALAYVAKVSYLGNQQHNPGQPLHWARSKSQDHDNCILRHYFDRGRKDSKGVRHRGNLAWRALAALQIELEEAKQNGEEL